MMNTKKMLLYVAYSIGAFLAALSFIKLLLMLLDPETGENIKEYLSLGTSLCMGWLVLLVTALFKPFKSRNVLLITEVVFVMIIIMNTVLHNQELSTQWQYWFSLIIPGIMILFYLFVFFYSRPAKENEDTIESQ